MSIGAIITLVVAAVLLVAIVILVGAKTRGGGRRRLRRHFGPEYERAVAVHDGDVQAAEKELDARLRRHGDLRPLPLTTDARRQYSAQWDIVQERFVDEPSAAVIEADLLIGRLARDRGYPADAYDEQVDALSVHHAHTVDGYRRVHEVAGRAHGSGLVGGSGSSSGSSSGLVGGARPFDGSRPVDGSPGAGGIQGSGSAVGSGAAGQGRATGGRGPGTEELREALVQARALFTELLRAAPEQDTARHRRRNEPARRQAQPEPAAEPPHQTPDATSTTGTPDTAGTTDTPDTARHTGGDGRLHPPWTTHHDPKSTN
ncbi:hypothetical protein [Streptomyces sp. MST-110588]|uniref:hypothetical protein n=1 Tax=Streptomyces sp. MST-110588 TaxID=2833628 RepID=UPI001F5C4FBC|nr:hypothetical protein [Streptomyces sp. MST-110588]UNO42311.1 hypothetical protein KGS77_25775 [Streptomyces sp. MST-110588]